MGAIVTNDWLNIGWKYRLDTTYGTVYRGAAPTETSAPYDREEYGGFFTSKQRFYIEGDYAKVRQFNIQFRLVPIYFEPYIQRIDYYRSEDDANNGPSIKTVAYRDLNLLEFSTKRLRNIKTFVTSIQDYLEDPDNNEILPMKSDWEWDEDNEVDEKDPYYSWKILEEIDADIVNKNWYGEHTWFDEVTIYQY